MDYQFLLGPLGISFLLSLSAYGSCQGMANCGSSATLYSSKPAIITYSYVSMIMISTVFFYAFILSIIIMNQFDNQYSISQSIYHFSSSILFGVTALSSGLSMGNISKNGFRRISQNHDFFMSFLISLASIEVTLVIAFLCSLLLIYKK